MLSYLFAFAFARSVWKTERLSFANALCLRQTIPLPLHLPNRFAPVNCLLRSLGLESRATMKPERLSRRLGELIALISLQAALRDHVRHGAF